MANIIDFQYNIDCIDLLDVADFISVGTFAGSTINITRGADTIANLTIANKQRELENGVYITKNNTVSTFAKLKTDIDIPVSELTTFKNIVEYVLTAVGITYDASAYTTTANYAGTKDLNGNFVDFTQVSCVDIILYCLAIDGYIICLDESGEVFFTSTSAAASTSPTFTDLVYNVKVIKTLSGITLYDCDKETDTPAILRTNGDGSTKIIHRLFGTGSDTYATAFADALYNGFRFDLETITWTENVYRQIGYTFTASDVNLALGGTFTILAKRTIIKDGAVLYQYKAVKQAQCIQLYLQANIMSKLFATNNFKSLDVISVEESLDNLRETMSIVSVSAYYDSGVPKIDLQFSSEVADSFDASKFKLWW